MVNARLHIICGNCGCNDMFEYCVDPSDFPEDYSDDVEIVCKNCSTIHSLNDNAEDKSENQLRAELSEAKAKAVELGRELEISNCNLEELKSEILEGQIHSQKRDSQQEHMESTMNKTVESLCLISAIANDICDKVGRPNNPFVTHTPLWWRLKTAAENADKQAALVVEEWGTP